MGIKYYKLLDLLNRRGIKKTDLRAILSTKTIAKLSTGGNITTDVIEKICEFLNCQPGDIMEYVQEQTIITEIDGKEVELEITDNSTSYIDAEPEEPMYYRIKGDNAD